MLSGKLIKLLDLLQQKHLANARFVPAHNDQGCGLIDDADGRELYFSRDLAQGRCGFDDLREGQQAVDQSKRVNR